MLFPVADNSTDDDKNHCFTLFFSILKIFGSHCIPSPVVVKICVFQTRCCRYSTYPKENVSRKKVILQLSGRKYCWLTVCN